MLSGGLPPYEPQMSPTDTGHVPLTDAPGFGVEIDPTIAERYLASGEALF